MTDTTDDIASLLASVLDGDDPPAQEVKPEVASVITSLSEAEPASDAIPTLDEIMNGAEIAVPMEPATDGPGQVDAPETLAEAGGTAPDMEDIPRRKSEVLKPFIPVFTSTEIAETIDIRSFGTLVTLYTARWHAKVKDVKAAQDAALASGADVDAYDARKKLLVGCDEKLKRIHKAIDAARTRHYQMTLPWSTVSATDDTGKRTGGRLLPNTLFMEYTTAMAHAKAEMDAALADFVSVYPQLIQQVKVKLDTAFNITEYPPASAIAGHFALEFDFLPIPKGGDFQGLADAQVSALANKLQDKTEQMLENAMQDAWLRLREIVHHASIKFNNADAVFHYTMIDKLRDAATMLKHLNITNDPLIESVRTFVQKNLTMHDVKDIRKDDALRKRLGKLALQAVCMMEDQS
jgi:hypothetical protein